MKQIDNYMSVSESANRWGLSVDTVRNKIKPSVKGTWAQTEELINEGLVKFFQAPGGQKKDWIISVQAMEKWFGKKV